MATYQIAELRPDAIGGFCPRGGALKLWKSKAHEVMLAGPAETGKTYSCMKKLNALLWKYPCSQAVMIRKTLSSLYTSCFQTYKNAINWPETPIRFYGGEKPEWADYPNGSRLYFAGMDNPQKALSSERDFIYVNQAEELTLDDWETLTTRCTGRAAHSPYAQMFGDCNPGPPAHWIRQRASLQFLESRHEDNPTLYDEAGQITERGQKTMAVLDDLTGVRLQRLRYGKWVQAEGAVYEDFDAAVHLIDRFDIPVTWLRYWLIDFGFTNPFVWQDWAIDPDGRAIRVHEIYMTGRIVSDHAADILKITKADRERGVRPYKILCDHDAEDRATLERHLGMRTQPAHKPIAPGIQAVQKRLRKAGDGKPRIFFFRDALHERDEILVAKKHPFCTEMEFEVYVWPKGVDGKPIKEIPVDAFNHGMDTTRYLANELDTPKEQKAKDVPIAIDPMDLMRGVRIR